MNKVFIALASLLLASAAFASSPAPVDQKNTSATPVTSDSTADNSAPTTPTTTEVSADSTDAAKPTGDKK